MTPARILLAAALLAAGCIEPAAPGPPDAGEEDDAADAGSTPDAAGCARCADFGKVADLGPLPPELVEISGLAASRRNPGVLWAHNDSGDGPRLVALSASDASRLGVYELKGAGAVDWEDVAVGPCPAGSCVYVGDIGDNPGTRSDCAVYRVPEPAVDPGAPAGTVALTGWERLPFEYPGGARHDAETLLVHPRSGEVYVLTKKLGGTSVAYRFPQPLTPGEKARLLRTAELPVPASRELPLTGGDVHPCGDAILLRTYSHLYELRVPEGQPFSAVFAAPAVERPVASEGQGEAVAWRADGLGYFTASEGRGETLHAVGCR